MFPLGSDYPPPFSSLTYLKQLSSPANMKTFAILTLLAGLAGSIASAPFNGLNDYVTVGLYHTKGPNQFHETTADLPVNGTLRDPTLTAAFLFSSINDRKAFKWSPDTTKIPIQQASLRSPMIVTSLTFSVQRLACC
jgi:hypothetical protein